MDRLAEVLLRRGIVVPELVSAISGRAVPGGVSRRRRRAAGADTAAGTWALEADLLQRGFVVAGTLWTRLHGMDAGRLAEVGHGLLHALDAQLGAHVEHVPLFRGFPYSVPADTFEFYVRRVFVALLQEPYQPCVLCGRVATVEPVNPCAHLICRDCWDGAEFGACPICHRRIDPDDPFLIPSDDPVAEGSVVRGLRTQTRLLTLADDPAVGVAELLARLLARQTPLSRQDRDDLLVLLERADPARLPDKIPVRETRALVVAGLLPRLDHSGAAALLDQYVTTATDVLRLLYVLMGGDPGLRIPPLRRTSLPRGLRRLLLARLDGMPLPFLAEDLHRYGGAWKLMAEVLHPYEYHRRYPHAALAFAAVRGRCLDETALGRWLADHAATRAEVFRVHRGRLRVITFGSRVEQALRDGDVADAATLLAGRPGELLRRLHHLLRTAQSDDLEMVGEVVTAAVQHAAPGPVIAALGQLRTEVGGTRLFLPRGGSARIWSQPDSRTPLPSSPAASVAGVLVADLLRRFGRLPPIGCAVLDEALSDLTVPTAERSSSAALVRLSRGSVQPLPDGDRVRLFLHWAEPPGQRVDLDLSLAFFDDEWTFVGLCDFTNLRLADDLAVHSGDLTSAPEPLGASEFVDLDTANPDARFAVAIVFSYNDVPFDKLPRGFAGFMHRPDRSPFDPQAVEQRFDLAGPAKIIVPLVIDLRRRSIRWADLNLSAVGYGHNVRSYEGSLARLGAAMESVFSTHGRVTMWELACWRAAAQAERVLVRHRDGALSRFQRRTGEDVTAFAGRVLAVQDADGTALADRWGLPEDVGLAVLVHGDLDLPDGTAAYALYPWRLDAARVSVLDAADLVSGTTGPFTRMSGDKDPGGQANSVFEVD